MQWALLRLAHNLAKGWIEQYVFPQTTFARFFRKMSDGRRSCLGFVFLVAALVLSAVFGISGWVGQDFRTGATLGIGVFLFFTAISAYMFITIKDYAWLPAVLGGLYALLPDLILGPTDDIGVLLLGTVVSGVLAWRNNKKKLSST